MIVTDIELEYGAEGLVEVVILDNLTNLPLNLSTYSMSMVLGDSLSPLFTDQSSANVAMSTNGTISILFDAATTTNLHKAHAGNTSYRVYITSPEGVTLLASKGFINIQ